MSYEDYIARKDREHAESLLSAPPQDGYEIERAFESLGRFVRTESRMPWDVDALLRMLATIHRTMEGLRAAQRRHDQETASIHSDMLALGRALGVPYDGLKSPAGYLHADIMPAVERLRAERDAAREDWQREADEHVRTALRCRGCEEAPVGQHTAPEAVSDNELAHPGLSSAEDGVTAANRPDAAPPQDAPQPLQSVTESAPQDGDEIETAFETVQGYLPDRDGTGVSANAALATIHRTMEGLRAERDALRLTARENKWYAEKHGEQATDAEVALREATSRAEQAEAALREIRRLMSYACETHRDPTLNEKTVLSIARTALSRTSSTDTPETEDE